MNDDSRMMIIIHKIIPCTHAWAFLHSFLWSGMVIIGYTCSILNERVRSSFCRSRRPSTQALYALPFSQLLSFFLEFFQNTLPQQVFNGGIQRTTHTLTQSVEDMVGYSKTQLHFYRPNINKGLNFCLYFKITLISNVETLVMI